MAMSNVIVSCARFMVFLSIAKITPAHGFLPSFGGSNAETSSDPLHFIHIRHLRKRPSNQAGYGAYSSQIGGQFGGQLGLGRLGLELSEFPNSLSSQLSSQFSGQMRKSANSEAGKFYSPNSSPLRSAYSGQFSGQLNQNRSRAGGFFYPNSGPLSSAYSVKLSGQNVVPSDTKFVGLKPSSFRRSDSKIILPVSGQVPQKSSKIFSMYAGSSGFQNSEEISQFPQSKSVEVVPQFASSSSYHNTVPVGGQESPRPRKIFSQYSRSLGSQNSEEISQFPQGKAVGFVPQFSSSSSYENGDSVSGQDYPQTSMLFSQYASSSGPQTMRQYPDEELSNVLNPSSSQNGGPVSQYSGPILGPSPLSSQYGGLVSQYSDNQLSGLLPQYVGPSGPQYGGLVSQYSSPSSSQNSGPVSQYSGAILGGIVPEYPSPLSSQYGGLVSQYSDNQLSGLLPQYSQYSSLSGSQYGEEDSQDSPDDKLSGLLSQYPSPSGSQYGGLVPQYPSPLGPQYGGPISQYSSSRSLYDDDEFQFPDPDQYSASFSQYSTPSFPQYSGQVSQYPSPSSSLNSGQVSQYPEGQLSAVLSQYHTPSTFGGLLKVPVPNLGVAGIQYPSKPSGYEMGGYSKLFAGYGQTVPGNLNYLQVSGSINSPAGGQVNPGVFGELLGGLPPMRKQLEFGSSESQYPNQFGYQIGNSVSKPIGLVSANGGGQGRMSQMNYGNLMGQGGVSSNRVGPSSTSFHVGDSKSIVKAVAKHVDKTTHPHLIYQDVANLKGSSFPKPVDRSFSVSGRVGPDPETPDPDPRGENTDLKNHLKHIIRI